MTHWYNRPLVFVRDCTASLAFYREKLGFAEAWRHAEDGRLLIAQVERDGTELILTEQWPEKAGQGVMFISLDPHIVDDGTILAATRAELEGLGAQAHEGQWGYRLVVIRDPDGNELWFPHPAEG